MRLFVAAELDAHCRDAAGAAGDQLRRRLGEVSWKWVPVANLHVTIRFIGYVPDVRVAEVLAGISTPLEVEPFDLALGGLGAFPARGSPRVLWVGLAQGLPGLQAMHDEFNRRLAPLGFPAEDRPFSAHVTLARAREGSPRGRPDARELARETGYRPAACRISHATVFESRMSPDGPRYVPLARIPCLSGG